MASLRRGAAAADTIFALSTPPGRSALALVRVSGPLALTSVARAVLRAPSAPAGAADGPPPLPPRRASVRAVVHPRTGAPLDVGVATAFPGPASATGEDVLELSVHGGRAVVAAVVDALGAVADDVVARGGGGRVRPAEPGEFTRRAYLAGRLDAAQVEGLADLLAADTEAQRRLALASASGALSSAYDGWRRELVSLLAAAEAALEFAADGDVDDAAVAAAARPRVAALLRALRAHAASARAGALVRDGASVVLVGAPNAGKSSLLNALSRRPAAIVAPQPGTTRDALEVPLDLGGLPVTLVDTAGLRGAPADEAEAEGIARARERAARAHVRLALVDAGGLPARGRGGAVRLAHLPPDVAALFAAEGRSAVEGAAGEGAGVRSGGGRAAEARAPDGARPRTLLVLNKCDDDADDDDAPIDADSEREGGRAEPAGAAGGASVRVSARVSCLTGRGVARLLRIVEAEARALASAAGGGGDGDAPVLARARHARHVAACIAALEAWSGEGPAALPPDAAAEELRVAANALASIVAVRVDTEEVLDVLFETFCVGK